jgi:hypothetical protein
MFRKLSLVAVAAMSLGAAALAPSPAAAWGGWHGGWHPGWHGGYYHAWYRPWGWGPRYYAAPVHYGYGGCYVRRVVPTPWGPRWRLVNRCY